MNLADYPSFDAVALGELVTHTPPSRKMSKEEQQPLEMEEVLNKIHTHTIKDTNDPLENSLSDSS